MDKKRTFQQIARDVKSTWMNVYFGAVPYLEALLTLDTTDPEALYGIEKAGDIARYFLANAQIFRGADARRLKEELKTLINNEKEIHSNRRVCHQRIRSKAIPH